MPQWTKEQSDAIYQSGKNIIVSAGAGSGKTAVLSERVLKKVESGIDVDRLLILTFTKAAASEMKERIRKKIKGNKELSFQLKKIDSSYITTFDSFSLSLVKKYHYLLNVKKNIDIIESNLLKIKIDEFLDEVMEEEYQKREKDFVKLINDFCVKDDYELKRIILVLNDKLNMKYDKEDYLNNYLQDFYSQDRIKKKALEYVELLKNEIDIINRNLTKLSNEVDVDYFNKLMNLLEFLLNSNHYDSIRDNLIKIERLPNMPKGSSEEAKKIKSIISETIKHLKDLCRVESFDKLIESIMDTSPYISAMIRIINMLDEKINSYKFENDLYDFVDISKMAIKLVKENDDIRREITDYFVEILIDEYQDTSDLQEEFIKTISNNNLYMVGDVKQSIYRFRNANPNIFRHKYNLYAKNIGGMKIDLLKNFRSREEVLSNINLLFDYIMDDLIGGADYIKEHEMVFGNTSYNVEGKTNQNNNFEIYQYDYEKNNGFKEEEIEAFIIANDILEKVHNHYQVFDKDEKKLRDITFNDFSILIDRSTSFELYKKVFLYKQIPLSIYKDEYLTNSSLFSVIKNIYKLIALVYDKKMNKEVIYAYLSIGRSFLFNYSDNELFDVIRNKSFNDTLIFKIVQEIVCDLPNKSISEILDEVIIKFNVYKKLRTIPDLENNYIKIDYLYTLAENLNKMGYTLRDFDEYLENIDCNGTDIKFGTNKEDNVSVKIMTIHKSKGLEYHICYFPGLTKKFNDGDVKERITFDNELGIITPYYDEGIDNTFYQELMKNNFYHENISEQIRLFYVALTRAKEKMIFIMPNKEECTEEYEGNLVSNDIRLNYHSFADILNSVKSKIESYTKKIDLNKVNLTKDYNYINNGNLFEKINNTSDILQIIDYPKYEKRVKDEGHFSKSNARIFTKEEKEKMSFGTQVHYLLETLDLKNPVIEEIPYAKDNILKFLNSDLMKKISNAKIYQEYEFIYDNNDSIMHGVIDLMLEYDDYIDIIDYKLKNIMDDAYIIQLTGYRDYIEKITGKIVNTYLYSIIDGTYQKI